jgi:hypothetical protein
VLVGVRKTQKRFGESCLKNEKGPGKPGPWSGTCDCSPATQGAPDYFFFFGAAFFFAGAFFVALFID